MRGTFFRLATVLTLTGLLGVSPALAEPKPIGGKLLKLKTDKGSAKNLFLFKAVAQPAIAAIPDPTAGTTLLLRWQTATGDGRTQHRVDGCLVDRTREAGGQQGLEI